MPPMQKRALYEFIANVILVIILVPLIVFFAEGIWDIGQLLLVVILVVTPSGLAYWIPQYLTRPKPDQPVVIDERDRAVLSRVPKYQFAGVLLTIGVWIVILLAIYSHQQQVPVGFLWLMWWSVIIANGMFTTAGVMIEYWRAGSSPETEREPDYYLIGGLSRGWLFALAMGIFIAVMVVSLMFRPSQSGPQANFSVDQAEVQVGDPIQFTDTTEQRNSSHLGEAAAQRWEFGDGTWSDEPGPLHAYASPGEYTVWLTIFYPGSHEVHEVKSDYITVLPTQSP